MISLRSLSPRASLVAVLAASSSLLAACDADPIGGGSGGGGGGGGDAITTTGPAPSTTTGPESSTSTSTVGPGGQGHGEQGQGGGAGGVDAVGGGPAASGSIALYGHQLPTPGEGGGTSVGVGGSGPGGDDDRLYLFVTNTSVACAEPFGFDHDCHDTEFKAIIGLPREYQQAGTYELDDPAITASYGVSGPNPDDTCFGGGGSFLDGTIQIVSVNDDRVRLVLDGTSPSQLEGEHTALFCGGSGPGPEESSVIGYDPSDLPPPDGESSSVSTGAGEEKFILVFADHAQSCADPFGDPPGPGEAHHELVIRLPPAYLAPGSYELADPMVEADSYTFEENTAASGGGSGTMPGVLVIHEVTDETIDLELSGTEGAVAALEARRPWIRAGRRSPSPGSRCSRRGSDRPGSPRSPRARRSSRWSRRTSGCTRPWPRRRRP
jgi:hypothetical protein